MGRIRLNDDPEVVKTVREGLAARGGYCPCRVERTEEYKCICQEFRRQIADPILRATATACFTTKKNDNLSLFLISPDPADVAALCCRRRDLPQKGKKRDLTSNVKSLSVLCCFSGQTGKDELC